MFDKSLPVKQDPFTINPQFGDVSAVHDLVDGIMAGRYTVEKEGSIVVNQTSVILSEENKYFSDETVKATGREAVGSIKSIVDAYGKTAILRKQENGLWVNAEYPVLDNDEESGYTESMSEKEPRKIAVNATALVPLAHRYLDAGLNVMLISLHGVGKTATVKALAEERGMKWKYYSCATLDPFTDLVGVPMPRVQCQEHGEFENRAEHRLFHADCREPLTENLKMVRPREIDEAEFIFFDEFNRADPKVQNAVFEIIQFRSINGEPLKNLKACWAAINPPDEEQNYAVEQMDPALQDRFDLYIQIQPKPSVAYMSQLMPEQIARALVTWWNDHKSAINTGTKDSVTDYISPRRLEKIGLVWCATQNSKAVWAALPPGGNFEKKKLVDNLGIAQNHIDQQNGGPSLDVIEDDSYDEDELGGDLLGDRPCPAFTYKLANMRLQANDLGEYLKAHPSHEATHNKVVETLRQGVGGHELVSNYWKVLEGLHPSKLEGMIAGFLPPKVTQMRTAFIQVHEHNKTPGAYKNLYKALSQSAPARPTDWPSL